MTTYKEEINKAMRMLARDKNVLFVGQGTRFSGHGMFDSLKDLPEKKRIEMPVCEELQTGICTGLALEGFIPISIYPRMDFLICATNQIVNHLDKIREMSGDEFNPKVIIRTAIGSNKPLMPGCQHNKDYTTAFMGMCTNINVVKLTNKKMIVEEYKKALNAKWSTIIVEVPELYDS